MKNNNLIMKECLVLLIYVLISGNTQGQNSFQKIATPPELAGSGLVLEYAEAGYFIIGGIVYGNNDMNGLFLQRVGLDGSAAWTKKIVGFPSQPFIINGLALYPDNSILTSIPFYDPQSFTFRQVVLKVDDSANTIEWATQIGAVNLYNFGPNLISYSSTEILIAHESNPNPNAIDISVSSLSTTGGLNWSSTYFISDNYTTLPSCILKTNPNESLICGYYNDKVSNSLEGGILLWVNGDGEIVKSKIYQNAAVYSVDTFPNGDLLIAGSYSDDRDQGFVALTDSDGNIQWAKKIIVNGIASSCKALITNDGGFVVFLKRKLSNNDYNMILKFNSQTDIVWQRKQDGFTDISGNLTGVIAGDNGFANISFEGGERNTVLIKTDLDGNVEGCPLFETCSSTEFFNIDTVALSLQRKHFQNSSIPLNLELHDTNVEYVDFCKPIQIPIPDFQLLDTICVSECLIPQNLQQQVADAWLWSGASVTFPDAQTPGEICFYENGASTIQHIIYFGGCSDTSEQIVEVIPVPKTGINSDTIVCDETSFILNASTPSGISYKWENGLSLPIREVGQSGLYSVTVDNGFCTSSDTIAVQFVSDIFDQSNIELGIDTSICKENNLLFGGDLSVVDEFWWNDGNLTSPRPINTPGEYVLSAVINGCFFNDSINIEIENCGDALYLPNAFSPNGDNLNDTFTAFGTYHQIKSLQVFNRWGGLVWDAEGDLPWDGTFKGQPAQPGVYVYLLKYTDVRTNEEKMISGDVVLIR